jgi:nitrous oxidase accessory protein NosD
MSRIIAPLLVLLFLTATCVIAVHPTKAASMTLVVPDDYPTITAAINNANEGDTIFVKKGTYEEKTLEINKGFSLVGEGAETTKINLDPPFYTKFDEFVNYTFSWFGPSITVDSDDFRLEGLTVSTTPMNDIPGGAISVTGNRTQIMGNHITTPLTVNGSYSRIAENTFSKTISVGSYSNVVKNRFLEDVSVTGSHSKIAENKFVGTIWASGSYLNISANNKASSNKVGTQDSGIHLEGSSSLIYGNNLTVKGLNPGIGVTGDGNTIVKNFVDHSDVGARIVGSNNIICANRITNSWEDYFFPSPNPIVGIGLVASGNNTVYANYLANNTWGTNVNQFQTNLSSMFYQNNFIGNTRQVATDNYYNVYGNDSFDNGKEGNFWSDYTGEDADGDGIGDTPYVIDANRSDRYPLMAPFDIDSVFIKLPDWVSSEPQASEPFPTTAVAIASVSAAVVVVGISLFLRKRKRQPDPYRMRKLYNCSCFRINHVEMGNIP